MMHSKIITCKAKTILFVLEIKFLFMIFIF